MSFCIGEVFELCRTGKYISPRHCRTVSIGDLDGLELGRTAGKQDMMHREMLLSMEEIF